MMFKSKHSGWTWDLKRTPFGGGGDIFQSIGNSLASIDPGPAIGKGLSEVDTFVNREIPGGWTLPAIIAAAYLSGGTSLAAEGALEAGAAAEGGGTLGSLGAGGSFVPAAEGASFTITPGAAYTAAGTSAGATAAGEAAYNAALENGLSQIEATNAANQAASAYANIPLETSTPGANSVLSQPDVTVNLGGNSSGSFGSLNPSLPAQGSVGGAGAGMSAELAPGTVMGTGLEGGGQIGVTYAAGANGLPATDFFGNYIPASSINTGGVPSTVTGTGYNLDTLKQINQARQGVNTANNLAKMLSQGSMSGLSSSLGKLAQGANPYGMEQLQVVRGNQNPFSYVPQQAIQDKKPDLSALAELLKQG